MASLVVELKLHREKKPLVIKKGQSYQLIQTKQFRFLDVCSYLAPGVSYQKFLEMYGIAENKSFFPYEFLDSPEMLEYLGLPPKEAFYSRLKGCNTLGADPEEISRNYNALKEVWASHEMVTLRDLLVFYNVVDVRPGKEAISKMIRFYKEDKRIDLFKSAISVPGVARNILFRTAKEQNAFFYSFSKNESEIYRDFKASITGGISQVFCRYAEKGKTHIRRNKDHPVALVRGFDSNSLYLYCLSKPCPSGRMIHRTVGDKFRPRCELKQFYAIDYLDYVAQKENTFIEHKWNVGERRIGPFMVDGYTETPSGEKIVYEAYGCWFHCHPPEGCPITSKIQNENWLKNQEKVYNRTLEREEYLKYHGFKVKCVWECQLNAMKRDDPEYKEFVDNRWRSCLKYQPSKQDILDAVLSSEFYGFLMIDVCVPREWNSIVKNRHDFKERFENVTPWDFFKNLPPLFMNISLEFEQFSEHMKQYMITHKLPQHPRQLLVSGMSAEKLLVNSELVKFYLEYGLEITTVHSVYEFRPHSCFKVFQEHITEDRRSGSNESHKTTTKLLGVS